MEERYCFIAEWYDAQASLNRTYQLLYYPVDSSVELYEIKTKRHFLKRCKQDLKLADLYIGNMVTIVARTFKLVEFADAYTSRVLAGNQQKLIAFITSGHLKKLGQIVDSIYKSGLKIANMRQVQVNSQEAYQLMELQRDKPNFSVFARTLSDGPIIVLELIGADCQSKWINIIGVSDITSQFEPDCLKRVEENLLQSRAMGTNTAVYNDTTCCVIRPHLVASGMAGAVIFEIQKAGFEISAIQTVVFTKPNAEEFLEVYKGVVHEYPEMVDELTNGTAIAMEIKGENVHSQFREFVGPHDPEMARTLRPRTLRALFGLDKVKNGVHCTDLPEDAILEVEYFFRILDS